MDGKAVERQKTAMSWEPEGESERQAETFIKHTERKRDDNRARKTVTTYSYSNIFRREIHTMTTEEQIICYKFICN